jgi:hypothetical protein
MVVKTQESPHLQAFRAALKQLDALLLDPSSDESEIKEVMPVYEAIAQAGFYPVARQDLPSLFSPSVKQLEMRKERRVLILKQIPNELLCLPIVAVSFSTKTEKSGKNLQFREINECRLQVGIFKSTKSLAESTVRDIKAIGLRYELSEGSGVHNYAHVQFVVSLEKGAADLPGAPVWLPDSQPAIPLDSDHFDASALVINLIQSLYGPSVAVARFKSIWQHVTGSNESSDRRQVPRLLKRGT